MKRTVLFLFVLITVLTVSALEVDDLHGIWLRKEVYELWKSGEDPELLGTRSIELDGDLYDSIWINLAINTKSSHKYIEYCGWRCPIEKIEKRGTKLRLFVHSYNEDAKSVFDVSLIDENSILMVIISMDDAFWNDSQNASFYPNRDVSEVEYIRCSKVQH